MKRAEFIQTLRRSLSGKMNHQAVNEHIEYYENYFDTELAHGNTEDEILERLGDPRLIAKTILQTAGDSEECSDDEPERKGWFGMWRDTGDGRVFRVPGWLFLIVFCLVFFLLLWLVGSVISLLFPVILPLLLIWLIWRNRRKN